MLCTVGCSKNQCGSPFDQSLPRLNQEADKRTLAAKNQIDRTLAAIFIHTRTLYLPRSDSSLGEVTSGELLVITGASEKLRLFAGDKFITHGFAFFSRSLPLIRDDLRERTKTPGEDATRYWDDARQGSIPEFWCRYAGGNTASHPEQHREAPAADGSAHRRESR